MKKILFIANFNIVVREMTQTLSKFFQVQVCSADDRNIQPIISLLAPDLILVSLIHFDDSDILHYLTANYSHLPILTIGSQAETEKLRQQFGENAQFESLLRPVSA